MFKHKNDGNYDDGEIPAPSMRINWKTVRLFIIVELICGLASLFMGLCVGLTKEATFSNAVIGSEILCNMIAWLIVTYAWKEIMSEDW